jgi:hypothetical protein
LEFNRNRRNDALGKRSVYSNASTTLEKESGQTKRATVNGN